MKKKPLNSILLVMIFAFGCADQPIIKYGNPEKINEHESYYLILLAGQSNMVGQGKIEDILERNRFKNIYYFNYGMGTTFGIDSSKFGPEYGISRELKENFPRKKFIILKYAVSGSSLLDWSPKYTSRNAEITGHPEFGNLYDSLLTKIYSVTKDLKVKKVGLVWMQGERDARIPEAGVNYFQNFKLFINAIRRDLDSPDLPVVYGRINPPVSMYPAVDTVVSAQEKISLEIPNIFLLNTGALEKWGDSIHYSSAGQLELGLEFGKRIAELLRK